MRTHAHRPPTASPPVRSSHRPDADGFLDQECGENVDLRDAVQQLLANASDTGGFLEAQPGPDLAVQALGNQLGSYRLVEILGEGGMGVVYRARHEKTGSIVALKTLRAVQPILLRGLRREIRALERIRHPRIARLLDHGLSGGIPWYAMEFLPGTALRRVIHPSSPAGLDDATTTDPGAYWTAALSPGDTDPVGPFPEPSEERTQRALRIVLKLCAPLSYLHGEGIVHRDLKPDNVLLLEGEEPVVVDFGLVIRASGANRRDALEWQEPGVGTAAYIAPEQLGREDRRREGRPVCSGLHLLRAAHRAAVSLGGEGAGRERG